MSDDSNETMNSQDAPENSANELNEEKVDHRGLRERSNELRKELATHILAHESPVSESAVAFRNEHSEIQSKSDQLSDQIKLLVGPRDELKSLVKEARAIATKNKLRRVVGKMRDKLKLADSWIPFQLFPDSWTLDRNLYDVPAETVEKLDSIDGEIDRILKEASSSLDKQFSEVSEIQRHLFELSSEFKENEVKKAELELRVADSLSRDTESNEDKQLQKLVQELDDVDASWKNATDKTDPVVSLQQHEVPKLHATDEVLSAELSRLSTTELTVSYVVVLGLVVGIVALLSSTFGPNDNEQATSNSGVTTATVTDPIDWSGRWSLINEKEERLSRFPLDELKSVPTSDSPAPARVGSQWGFINTDGEWAIEAQFEDAEPFSEGLAAVKQKGKWGFIDRDRTVIADHAYENVQFFSEGLAGVQSGDRWGFIDRNGSEVIFPRFAFVRDFIHGQAAACTVSSPVAEFGLIDRDGHWTIQPSSRWPLVNEGIAGFRQFLDKDFHPAFVVNRSGKTIFEAESSVTLLDQSGEYALIQKDIGDSETIELVAQDSETRKRVLLPQMTFFAIGYDIKRKVDDWNTFLIPVQNMIVPPGLNPDTSKFMKFGFMNWDGKLVIPHRYSKASYFSGDLAVAAIEGKSKDDQIYGVINRRGEYVFTPQYDNIGNYSDGWAVATKNGMKGFIGQSADETIDPAYRDALPFRNGIAAVQVAAKLPNFSDSKKTAGNKDANTNVAARVPLPPKSDVDPNTTGSELVASVVALTTRRTLAADAYVLVDNEYGWSRITPEILEKDFVSHASDRGFSRTLTEACAKPIAKVSTRNLPGQSIVYCYSYPGNVSVLYSKEINGSHSGLVSIEFGNVKCTATEVLEKNVLGEFTRVSKEVFKDLSLECHYKTAALLNGKSVASRNSPQGEWDDFKDREYRREIDGNAKQRAFQAFANEWHGSHPNRSERLKKLYEHFLKQPFDPKASSRQGHDIRNAISYILSKTSMFASEEMQRDPWRPILLKYDKWLIDNGSD